MSNYADYPAKFKIGDHVQIARLNNEADLPDDDCDYAGDFPSSWVGREIVITADHEYDPADNSWQFWDDDEWVHEGALEYALQPVTQDEEDEAIASIRTVSQMPSGETGMQTIAKHLCDHRAGTRIVHKGAIIPHLAPNEGRPCQSCIAAARYLFSKGIR